MGNGEWGMGNGIAPKIFVHKNFRRDWGMGNGYNEIYYRLLDVLNSDRNTFCLYTFYIVIMSQ
jgi:hypothetical protein